MNVGDANGTGEPQNIVCGATNFAVGDHVVVILPGGVLPGGFQIGARKTYGHVSEGMICSVSELGIGEDHSGILVLPADTPVGADAIELLGLRDDVLDIAVTPDRGYALSIRGLAREAATAYGVPFKDPADVELPAKNGEAYPASIGDPSACDRFVLREVRGFDADAKTPMWMQVRLHRAGMRPVSLAVDITNYLMLELGQPLHLRPGQAHRADRGGARRPARSWRRSTTSSGPSTPTTSSSPTSRGRSRLARWAASPPRSTTGPPTWSSRPRTSTPWAPPG